MSCCNKYFGEYAHNKDIVLTGLYAEYDGEYTIKIELPGGSKYEFTVDVLSGDEITIPKMKLNESAVVNFQVFDQWGEVVPFKDEYGEIVCEKLSLKTYINQNVECKGDNCDEDETEETYY